MRKRDELSSLAGAHGDAAALDRRDHCGGSRQRARSPRGERAAVEDLHGGPLMLMVGGDRIRRFARETGRTDGRICARAARASLLMAGSQVGCLT